MGTKISLEFSFDPYDHQRLLSLLGPNDQNLLELSRRMGIEIHNHGASLILSGPRREVELTSRILDDLYARTAPAGRDRRTELISPQDLHLAIIEHTSFDQDAAQADPGTSFKIRRGYIKARTAGQKKYIAAIRTHVVTFGVGPAGTGKTYLAVAAAVEAFERGQIRRIVLTRPAVEAGEKLGFLPGDLSQKVDPYLRPLYDSLYEMLGFEKAEKLLERQTIEIAPLAYMRGRTLNDAFIILDEAQNTTVEQMKMFLTRLGFNSKAVITGDPSQTDLPRNIRSGLKHALSVLSELDEIGRTELDASDVVRHPVVAAIVSAYARHEADASAHQDHNLSAGGKNAPES